MKEISDLFDVDNMLYSPIIGVNNCKTQVYNEFLHKCYEFIFKLFDKYKLDYYVFAGSAVGYVRNKKNIPWADDYDILIFEKEKDNFEKNIIPILKIYNFTCGTPHTHRPDLYKKHVGWQIWNSDLNLTPNVIFLCDVFMGIVDKEGFVRSPSNFGNFNKKNNLYKDIYPKKYVIFDGLKLPFFNNIEKNVEKDYGDVFNKTIIHVNHGNGGIIKLNKEWNESYKEFNKYINIAKKNTHSLIFKNKLYNKKEKIIINKEDDYKKYNIKKEIDILVKINKNNIGKIFIDDNKEFLLYCFAIKHYYPDIKIHYYSYSDINNIYLHFINSIDYIYCLNNKIKNYLNNSKLIYLNKPIIKLTNVITFGTYDLFHIGHKKLFENCKKYGNKLIVGVSSNELNIKKGKNNNDNIEIRIENCKKNKNVDEIFIEESLEKKDEYIKKYNANLLIMGDDWKNKFDWVSIMTKYIKRTPNISSSMLKNKYTN